VERSSFSAVQKELDALKQRYRKVIEFIESLGLKEKLEKFLQPITLHRRGRYEYNLASFQLFISSKKFFYLLKK